MNKIEPFILIVDDNVVNLQVTTNFLRKLGYRIGLAQSGQAALDQIETYKPDLILLDIMMPGMDGIETCRKIKSNPLLEDVPIIFLTAKTATEDLVEAYKVGGVDYVTKPFHKDELISRVKIHLDLFLARKRIENMNRSRDRMYSIIAHDIKTPFSNIMLMIDAFKHGYIECGSDLFKETIDRLLESTNSTYALLQNLLTWTRFQSDMSVLSPQMNDLSAMVYETVHLLQQTADSKFIKVSVDMPTNLHVFYDKTTINTVFRNILSNAIKFTPEKGMIRVFFEDDGPKVKLMVEDTGVGMSEQMLKNILTENKSISTYGTNNESGTGLGFLLIKDFVEYNGGTLEVESEVDVGTLVKISLYKSPSTRN
nr:hybrid sensor histidine kinase/response regulator [uncultured Carboxylicivirga sp.]